MIRIGGLLTMLYLISGACSYSLPPDPPAASEGVYRIAIPDREHGYNNFKSLVLSSADSLNNFLSTMDSSAGWNNWTGFRDSLLEAPIDFSQERLLLFRHTETSGSIVVTVGQPYAAAGEVVVPLNRNVPPAGTTDMAYYCYAFRINREVPQIRIKIEGMEDVVFTFAVAVD